jgi:segregation and condensation protein A
MSVETLELELEVFQGPFDLLLALVLREEIDLREVELAEIVLSYLEHLQERGELDLEAATEFLMLLAALLELKSRLLLPGEEEDELPELEPREAVEELLARMVEYHRYRSAAAFLHERLSTESGFGYRSAPLPPGLRRVAPEAAAQAYEPALLGEAIGGLLRTPPPLDPRHLPQPLVSVERRLAHLRSLLERAGSVSFDDAVAGADRLTEAVTLFALLELYKSGEAHWEQEAPFGPITVKSAGSSEAPAPARPEAAR